MTLTVPSVVTAANTVEEYGDQATSPTAAFRSKVNMGVLEKKKKTDTRSDSKSKPNKNCYSSAKVSVFNSLIIIEIKNSTLNFYALVTSVIFFPTRFQWWKLSLDGCPCLSVTKCPDTDTSSGPGRENVWR